MQPQVTASTSSGRLTTIRTTPLPDRCSTDWITDPLAFGADDIAECEVVGEERDAADLEPVLAQAHPLGAVRSRWRIKDSARSFRAASMIFSSAGLSEGARRDSRWSSAWMTPRLWSCSEQ